MKRVLLATLLLALLGPAAAQAEYGPGADPVSVDYGRLEQGDDSTVDADITPDGRYVAIQTRATNFFADADPDPPGLLRRGGIFRFDRQTHDLAFVADGDQVSEDTGAIVLRGAANPSISDDGRYVVFATAQRLTPADTNDNVDVYRRDLALPVGPDRAASGAYTLVSARDGSDVPASYAPRVPPLPGRSPGTDVTPNLAISGDGSRVAFRSVELASDLPAAGTTDTPSGQVFVRDIPARTTTLITKMRADGAPAGGAFGPAVLSDDGSTVVWTGGNAAGQTPFMPGERSDDPVHFYLWRRLDGSTTRRVTGMAEPEDPACAGVLLQLNPLATGPCYGPLTSYEEEGTGLASIAPAVSRDGYRVAFLTSQGLRPTSTNQTGLDAFVTDMSPGVSRKAGTIEVTRDPQGGNLATIGSMRAISLSGDGNHIALTTTRTSFVLPAYSSLGTFRALPDTAEIYVVDLVAHTIDRVVRNTRGTDANGDAGDAVTLSQDAGVVAFTSLASNLFYGDANSRGDAFAATRVVPRTDAGAPPPDANRPDLGFDLQDSDPPDLETSLVRRTDGGLDVTVKAPAAGSFQLAASTSASSSKRGATTAATKKVTVGTATRKVTKKGKVTIALKPGAKAKSLLKKSRRVALTVRIVFTPKAGSTTVTDTQTGSFVRPKAKKKAGKKAKKKAKSSHV